jgi:hypothetical protein
MQSMIMDARCGHLEVRVQYQIADGRTSAPSVGRDRSRPSLRGDLFTYRQREIPVMIISGPEEKS